jgi:hypothetical protein
MRRKFYQKLVDHLPKKEFTILTGARQTGKSTLLADLRAHCKAENIPHLFINLENKRLLTELDENPLNLLGYFQPTEGRTIVFIDEIQYLKDPTNFMKLLYDEHKDKVKIVASGSSAFYMDNTFRDSLAGRKRIFRLHTCDFEDYLKLQGKDDLWTEVERLANDSQAKSVFAEQLQREWESFMIYGGYPAVVTTADPNERVDILKEIRDSFVKRDVLEAGVRNETLFYQLFQILASQPGQLLNINELSNTLRTRNETIDHHLYVMQRSFHVVLIKPFFRNIRKELVKMPKSYLMDNGLRNSLINNFQPVRQRLDRGELWEQTLFRSLVDVHGLDSLHFWRTADGNEIDFILPDLHPPLAIESKLDEKQTKPSKYKSFQTAYTEFTFSFSYLYPWQDDFFRRNRIFG